MVWIFRLILFLAIFYNGFIWHTQVKSENQGNIVLKEVVFIDCNATKNSAIKIKKQDGYERVEVPRNYCRSLSEGDSIHLIYNKTLKSYHFPKNRSGRNVMIFLIIVFVISFFNINHLKNKFENKISQLLDT